MTRKSNIAIRRETLSNSGQAEYSARKREIVLKAAEIFREKGYQATNVNEIAAAAGIDRATLYYYAAGKKELFQEVVQIATAANVEMVERIAAEKIPPAEKIRRYMSGVMASYRDHPQLYVYVQEDMRKIGVDKSAWAKDMRDLSRRFDRAIVSIVEEGMRAKAFNANADARLIAYGIIGMMNWTHRWFKSRRGYTAEETGAAFAEMVINGLSPRGD
ncbi:MAG: TetR/AcrR family transcriptional regulator [Hyphomonadaceae bacterium]